jgi:DNA-binding NarL/FixJ family response regulator
MTRGLTPMQIEFLKLVGEEGLDALGIAGRLGKQVGNVQRTLETICNKLAVTSPQDAYHKAVAQQLLSSS